MQSLETKLDEAKNYCCDVIHIHGKQTKQEKFNMIHLFCLKSKIKGYEPRVLVTTSASDVGVDHPNAQHVTNLEWTDSVSTFEEPRPDGTIRRSTRRCEPEMSRLVAGAKFFNVKKVSLIGSCWRLCMVL